MLSAAALVVCLVGLANLWSSHQVANAQNQDNNSVVGVWEVNVGGAPFGPHLFTFHSDGTFLSSNPDAGDPKTSDSDGEGTWQASQQGNGTTVTGIFKEYDADRSTNAFVGVLTVTYAIKVTGNTFKGPASATFTDTNGNVSGPFPAEFTAYRLGFAPAGFPPG
jgi:hypothetical protein